MICPSWLRGLDSHSTRSARSGQANLNLATRLGVEPRYTDPESVVLPLDDLVIFDSYG